MKWIGLGIGLALGLGWLSKISAADPRPYTIHWVCPPLTTYLSYSCFAYRSDTGEIIASKMFTGTQKDLGLPAGTRP